MSDFRKPSDLKQHKFITLLFWRWEVWNISHGTNIKVSAGLPVFWAPGRIYSLIFPVGRGCPPCLSHDHVTLTFASIVTPPSPTLTLLSPSFTCNDPYDYINPTCIIQDNRSPCFRFLGIITSTKSPLHCMVTYSQVPGIRRWIYLVGHYSAYTYLIILNLPTKVAPAGHFQWLSTFSHIKSIYILMPFKDCYTWNHPFFLIVALTPFLHLTSLWSGHSLLGFKFWALVCVCSVTGMPTLQSLKILLIV